MRFKTLPNIRTWLVIYTSSIFAVALLFLVITWFPDFFNAYTIYPLVLNLDALKGQLACLVIPISIVTILTGLYMANRTDILHPLFVMALLGASAIACCARFSGLALVDKQQASLKYENNIYNVISSESDFGPRDKRWITLYECDNSNFFCKIIIHQYVLSTNATLIPNPTAHAVTLQINGETVYVHNVK